MEKVDLNLRPAVDNSIYERLGVRWYEAYDDPVALLRAESKAKTPWVIENIKKYFSLNFDTQVLDVGCGAGFLSNELAKVDLKVTGIDLSPDSLTIAKKYDESGKVHYQVADAYRLPFSDSTFEVATVMDFLEHVEDPAAVIAEISRVLKPGGVLIFHTFNRNILAHLIVIKVVEWLVKNTPRNMHVIHLFIKPKELVQYCKRANLEVRNWTGIKPVFSSIPIRSLFRGVVPESLRFELTSCLLLSYMGLAQKKS